MTEQQPSLSPRISTYNVKLYDEFDQLVYSTDIETDTPHDDYVKDAAIDEYLEWFAGVPRTVRAALPPKIHFIMARKL
jgi:hypothetical protein